MEQKKEAQEGESISRVKQIVAFILELNWFLSASAALVFFILLKKFVVDIARVNSQDMNNTFFYGDAVLIRRSVEYVQTGDVVQFSFPAKDSTTPSATMIQRIAGLPGDTVEIKDKVLFVNGRRVPDTSTVKHNFFVRAPRKLDSLFKLNYALWEGGEISQRGDYSYSLTDREAQRLRKDTAVNSVELKSEKAGNWDETLFPNSKHYRWNMDHYGPVYIPAKNDTLYLDTFNLALYERLITQYEKNLLEKRGDSIFINGQHTNSYVTKKSYYFVLGDNRDNASDSRSWGFLPENALKGKILRVIRRGGHE